MPLLASVNGLKVAMVFPEVIVPDPLVPVVDRYPSLTQVPHVKWATLNDVS